MEFHASVIACIILVSKLLTSGSHIHLHYSLWRLGVGVSDLLGGDLSRLIEESVSIDKLDARYPDSPFGARIHP